MRYDFFLVYPHGVHFIDDILAIIRGYRDVEIVYIRYFEPYDFLHYVNQVYSFDTVPLQHLKAKTEYLKGLGKETYFILVKNYKPEVRMVGEGEYRHEQSLLMNEIKWRIREEFNPRLSDGRRSEHHVIHASDYELQTRKYLHTFGYPPLEYFSVSPNKDFDAPYYLGGIAGYEIVEKDLRSIQARVITEGGNQVVAIEDTPHYQGGQTYQEYWEKHRGRELYMNHSAEAFEALEKNFLYLAEPHEKGFIITKDNVIIDGLHRAVILLKQGETKVPLCQI